MVFVWGSALGTAADLMARSMSSMNGHIMNQEAERRNHQSPSLLRSWVSLTEGPGVRLH